MFIYVGIIIFVEVYFVWINISNDDVVMYFLKFNYFFRFNFNNYCIDLY